MLSEVTEGQMLNGPAMGGNENSGQILWDRKQSTSCQFGGRREDLKSQCLMDTEFQFCKMRVLEVGVVMTTQQGECAHAAELCTWTWLAWSNSCYLFFFLPLISTVILRGVKLKIGTTMNMSPVSQLCPLPQRNPLVLFPLKDNTIELS